MAWTEHQRSLVLHALDGYWPGLTTEQATAILGSLESRPADVALAAVKDCYTTQPVYRRPAPQDILRCLPEPPPPPVMHRTRYADEVAPRVIADDDAFWRDRYRKAFNDKPRLAWLVRLRERMHQGAGVEAIVGELPMREPGEEG